MILLNCREKKSKRKQRSTAFIIAFIILIMLGSSFLTAFAEDGDGTGGGGDGDLTLVSAQFADGTNVGGANNVSCTGDKIKLAFSKNVADDLVWAINKACISVTDALGKTVKCDVTRISGDSASDEKRNIYISISGDMQSASSYQVHIGPELIAKNMMMKIGDATGGKEIVLSFRTKAAAGTVKAVTAASTAPAAAVKSTTKQTAAASGCGAAVTTAPATQISAAAVEKNASSGAIGMQKKTQGNAIKTKSKVTLGLAALVLLLIIAAVIVAVKRNHWHLPHSKKTGGVSQKYLWDLDLRESLGSTFFGVLTVIAGMSLHLSLHIPGHRGLLIMTMMTIGCLLYRKQGAGILIGSISGFVAVMLGIESKGLFGFFNYFFPGLMMDFFICVLPFTSKKWYLTGLASGIAFLSKLLSTYVVGMILGIPMGFLAVGLKLTAISHFSFGLAGGILGYFICMKTPLRRYAQLQTKVITAPEETV